MTSETTTLDDTDMACLDFISAERSVHQHDLYREVELWGRNEGRGTPNRRMASCWRLQAAGLAKRDMVNVNPGGMTGAFWSLTNEGRLRAA